MPPLPSSNTARLKVFYQNSVTEHSIVARMATAADAPDVETLFLAVIGDIGTLFNFTEVTAVQLAADGSDLFFDYGATTLLGESWGVDPTSAEHNATGMTFVGRSPLGRRAKFTLFGYSGSVSSFRLTSSENTGVENAVAALNASSTAFLAIDGGEPLWKSYADIKTNDHWVKKAR